MRIIAGAQMLGTYCALQKCLVGWARLFIFEKRAVPSDMRICCNNTQITGTSNQLHALFLHHHIYTHATHRVALSFRMWLLTSEKLTKQAV